MDFRSAYAHGFARVAACTLPVALAEPHRNAETTLEQLRVCHEESVALAVTARTLTRNTTTNCVLSCHDPRATV